MYPRTHILNSPIEYLKSVGPQRAELLKKELDIHTFYDLLNYFPYRYLDKSAVKNIRDLVADEYAQIKGRVISTETLGTKGGKRFVIHLKDDTGICDLIFFQGIKWLENKFKVGEEYIVFGKTSEFRNKANFVHPDIDLAKDDESSGEEFLPMYNSTEKLKHKGLDSKGIAKLFKMLIPQIKGHILDPIPVNVYQDLTLIPLEQAYHYIHLPQNNNQILTAQFRLKFQELFLLQVKILRTRINRITYTPGHLFPKLDEYFNGYYNHHLPFELTNAQKRVIKEIRKDTLSGKQMNRLVQGDVGSGKTMVAFMTMLMALDNGFQACLMAPTEILASQHYVNIKKYAEPLNIQVVFLAGSTKKSERTKIHSGLLDGSIKIIIGTHALLEDAVVFNNLGIAVIDEQHRFGVEQRFKLWKKNINPPHILVMTATPIPRTLAMTIYGDLDVSVIDELPAGRKPIVTTHRYDSHRLAVFGFMREQITQGRQVYIVYPLIEESEKLDLKNLMNGFDSISEHFPKPQYQLSIVHGKMSAADKEYEMQRFKNKVSHILIATTVIEVGVDVPNATVMIIENADRFGLSQLHQLRGRVGRGGNQSYCILMTSFKLGKEAKERIDTMVRTNDGFEISEVDLKLRGPGDIEGTQQSGILNLKIADIAKDQNILQLARNAANDLLNKDPEVSAPEHQLLLEHLKSEGQRRVNWSKVS